LTAASSKRTILRVIVRALVVVFVLLAAASAACGNPGDGDDIFTFNPQPYITMDGGTPIAADPETCTLYPADRVVVEVESSGVERFLTWADSMGFGLTHRLDEPPLNRSAIELNVPIGSVLDAIRVIRERPGVTDAMPNYIAFIGPYPTPDPSLPCSSDR